MSKTKAIISVNTVKSVESDSDSDIEIKTTNLIIPKPIIINDSESESEIVTLPVKKTVKSVKPRKPLSDEQKSSRVDSLAKARAAKALKTEEKKKINMQILKDAEEEILTKAKDRLSKDKKKAEKIIFNKLVADNKHEKKKKVIYVSEDESSSESDNEQSEEEPEIVIKKTKKIIKRKEESKVIIKEEPVQYYAPALRFF